MKLMSLLKEDVSKYTNAGISKFAVAIASLTATRADAVQKFADTYELKLLEKSRSNQVLINENFLELHVKKTSTLKTRQKIIDDFYRKNLSEKIPQFIAQYEPQMNVKVGEFRIKKMKTRWGTCSIKERRIWIALELSKRPISCLEFIVVHEMTHLLERKHNKRFFALMDKFMPNWRLWQKEL
jgi:predicted metal-dependent hydrolase